MTKAELIEALKDFPDDIEVMTCNEAGTLFVPFLELQEIGYWNKDKEFILIGW